MKRLQTTISLLVALALSGAITANADQPGVIPGKAIVRYVKGNVAYSVGGVSLPLKMNMEMAPGTMISTGPDSYVDLTINDGVSAKIRVSPDSTVTLEKMDIIGAQREGDTETMLDLKVGTILGQVKKVSANSRFEIKTPHGVAGIRGTDWIATVVQLPNGLYQVTFTSVEGTLVASAEVSGFLQTKTINGGESWTVGGEVVPVEIRLLQSQVDLINLMISEIQHGITPNATPVGELKLRRPFTPEGWPGWGVGPGEPPLPPFCGGGPPGGKPSSGSKPPFPGHHED